jgi:hypothetical protein
VDCHILSISARKILCTCACHTEERTPYYPPTPEDDVAIQERRLEPSKNTAACCAQNVPASCRVAMRSSLIICIVIRLQCIETKFKGNPQILSVVGNRSPIRRRECLARHIRPVQSRLSLRLDRFRALIFGRPPPHAPPQTQPRMDPDPPHVLLTQPSKR